MASLEDVHDGRSKRTKYDHAAPAAAAAVAAPVPPLLFTDQEAKKIKQHDNRNLFVKLPILIVHRANNRKNKPLYQGHFVGSLESARAYNNKIYPFLATYQMPEGYYMILNSSTRIDHFNHFFSKLLQNKTNASEIIEIKNLHILLRATCGMSKTSTTAGFIENYTQTDLDNLKTALSSVEDLNKIHVDALLDMNKPGLRPTRISVRGIDKYMEKLANRYLIGAQEVRDGVRKILCGIITSCIRTDGKDETLETTNASLYESPKSVAVPSEIMILVNPRFISETKKVADGRGAAEAGGKRTLKSRKRIRKRIRKTRKPYINDFLKN